MPRRGQTLVTQRAKLSGMGDMNVGKRHECIGLNDTVANCEHRVVPTVRVIDNYQVGRTRSERLEQGAPRI